MSTTQYQPVCRDCSYTFVSKYSDFFTTNYPVRAARAGLSDQVWCPLYKYNIYVCGRKKKFESYFRNRLTFSNIRSRTSRRIYRLALPLRAPKMLSLRKSRISIFNAHLTVFVHRMTSHNSIGRYRHLVN